MSGVKTTVRSLALLALFSCGESVQETRTSTTVEDPVERILEAARSGELAQAEWLFDDLQARGLFDVAHLVHLYGELPVPECNDLAERAVELAEKISVGRPEVLERLRQLRSWSLRRHIEPADYSQEVPLRPGGETLPPGVRRWPALLSPEMPRSYEIYDDVIGERQILGRPLDVLPSDNLQMDTSGLRSKGYEDQ